MFTPKFWATIKNGTLKFDNLEAMRGWVKQTFKEGSRIEIIIHKESEEITYEQYKYLYGAIYEPLSLQTGYRIYELDEIFKNAFAQEYGIWLPKGTMISKSMDFNKGAMNRFITFVQDLALEWWDFVPVPENETWKGN